MEHRSNCAAMQDAQTLSRRTVSEAWGKAQAIPSVCIGHGAQVKYKQCSSEGCTNHAQKGRVCRRHGAPVKRCSSKGCSNQVQRREECASSTGHIALHKTNLLRLDQSSRCLLQLRPHPIPMLPELSPGDKKEVAFLTRWSPSAKK